MNRPLIITSPEDLEILISQATIKAVKDALVDFQKGNDTDLKPELFTRKEACKALKISLPTLRDWTKRGLLKSFTLGGRIYYKSEELEKALIRIP